MAITIQALDRNLLAAACLIGIGRRNPRKYRQELAKLRHSESGRLVIQHIERIRSG